MQNGKESKNNIETKQVDLDINFSGKGDKAVRQMFGQLCRANTAVCSGHH